MTLNMVGVIVLAWLFSIGVVMSIESDPYKLLGISRDVTDAEVRKAYRRAALKYHPDK
jgi:preprotein translocase subunit Sec63